MGLTAPAETQASDCMSDFQEIKKGGGLRCWWIHKAQMVYSNTYIQGS